MADTPLMLAIAGLDAAVDAVRSVSRAGSGSGVVGAALVELTRVQARVAGLVVAVAADAERVGVGQEVGASSSAAWWSQGSRVTRGAAVGTVRLGTALEETSGVCRVTGSALAAGELVEAQARVIVAAVEDLPGDLDPELRALAEKHLVGLAADHDAKELRVLGRKILEVIAPDVAEEVERTRLADQERRAWDRAHLSMSDDGAGMTRGRFAVPTAQAEMLRRQVRAIATGQAVTSRREGRAPSVGARRLGQAFVEWIERCCAESFPTTGGVSPTVVVTMTLAQITGQITGQLIGQGTDGTGGSRDRSGVDAPVTLDDGTRVSAGQARRWACEAGLVPAVLGTGSVVLDLGRTTRFFTKRQRIAMGLRDGGCVAAGCDRPPSMCHAHHLRPWVAQKGESNLDQGRLLCGHHHRVIHDPAYDHQFRPDGKVQFTRRT